MPGDFYETLWQNSIDYRLRSILPMLRRTYFFKYKDGGSTGIMGFQFLCKMKKSWKGNDCPRYRQKIWKHTSTGGIS